MILFSDLHLCEGSETTVFDHVLPGIVHIAQRLGDSTVACLGDFWHLRYRIPVRLLNRVRAELTRWQSLGLTIWLLPGNHDQVDVHGQNALEILDVLPNVRVFTEPTVTAEGLWIPYRLPDRFERILAEHPGSQPLFMHQGVRGAWTNADHQDEDGIPQNLFGDRVVFSGHYHRYQQIRNLTYVGSPYQTKADESGETKGVLYLGGNGEVTRYNTVWGKRYHRLRMEDPNNELDLNQVRVGDDVRVTVAAGISTEATSRQLVALGVTHSITPDQASGKVRLAVEDQTLGGYALAYAQEHAEDLDVDQLMREFKGIVDAC